MIRAMGNAKLLAARRSRILVPAVYRNEYVGSRRRLTNHVDPADDVRLLMPEGTVGA